MPSWGGGGVRLVVGYGGGDGGGGMMVRVMVMVMVVAVGGMGLQLGWLLDTLYGGNCGGSCKQHI